jgi:hypothetical protein
MKNFFLILLGEFNETNVYEIGITISPMVVSPNLKFHYNEKSLVCHFSSDGNQNEILEYIKAALSGGVVDMVFLSETNYISVAMTDDMEKHLLDLDDPGKNVDMKIDMERVKMGLEGIPVRDLLESDLDLDEEEDDILIKAKRKIKLPTLDELLEKIHRSGIESLSTKEKELLNQLSK